jgi:hypothetical protein
MTDSRYPYPFLGITPPAGWPVATRAADKLARFERYGDDEMGFYTPNQGDLPPLDNRAPVESGYCVIVPREGGYSVKWGLSGGAYRENLHLRTEEPVIVDGKSVYYVKLPATFLAQAIGATEVLVNDQRIEDEDSRSISQLYQ